MAEEARAADVMYETPTAAPPAPTAARDADVMYGETQKPAAEPEAKSGPRVAAKSAMAESGADVMYQEDAAADADKPDAEKAADDADADAEQKVPEPAEDAEVLQVLPNLALQAPPGWTEWDNQMLNAVAPIMAKTNMDQKDAQQLLNLHVRALNAESAAAQQALWAEIEKNRTELNTQWRNETYADPEIKNYEGGVQLARSHAAQVLSHFFEQDFKTVLREAGVVNHPGLVRGLLRIYKSMNGRRWS